MKRIPATCVALVIAVLAHTGCGTIASRTMPGYDGPWIYSGTVMDVAAVFGGASEGGEGSIAALLIFDVPFSLVADTLLLPLTIYEQITGRRNPEEPETGPVGAHPGPPSPPGDEPPTTEDGR